MTMNREFVLSELNKLINICHSNLHTSSDCLNYLHEIRGLSPKQIKKYKLGYFPRSSQKLIQHVSAKVLQNLSILNFYERSDFSEFYFLIFPIFSEFGDAVGIGGRTLIDDDMRKLYGMPKYKNSAYKKSNILYGLNLARGHILQENNVYITEGYFDCIALQSHGIHNSVAVCGTAFSRNHFFKLGKYTNTLTFILDNDDAGQKSMEQIYSKFSSRGLKIYFLQLPSQYKDVDQYFAAGNTKNDFVKDFKNYIPHW